MLCFITFLLLHLCAESLYSISLYPGFSYLEMCKIMRSNTHRDHSRGSFFPTFFTSSPTSLYLRCHTWGLLTVCHCAHVLFPSPSAIYIALHHLDSLFHDLMQRERVPEGFQDDHCTEQNTEQAQPSEFEGQCCKSPGEADWHHELALSPD